jgi:hypothetical protein
MKSEEEEFAGAFGANYSLFITQRRKDAKAQRKKKREEELGMRNVLVRNLSARNTQHFHTKTLVPSPWSPVPLKMRNEK